MKKSLSKLFLFTFTLLTPMMGFGHPGHFVLDFSETPPHPGHQADLFTICVVLATSTTLALLARWISQRVR